MVFHNKSALTPFWLHKHPHISKPDNVQFSLLEHITANDKRRLQNVMAYGEYGRNITDKPRARSKDEKPSTPPKQEPDRFDEGMYIHLPLIIN